MGFEKNAVAKPRFDMFAVIDWSGQAVARPKGLAVAQAGLGVAAPKVIAPDGGWSRGAILDWLLGHAELGSDMLIGMDLSPAFPFVDQGAYFPGWQQSSPHAKDLWRLVDDLCTHDPHLSAKSFLAHPEARRHFRQHKDLGDLFGCGAGRFRVCEAHQRTSGVSPTSCYNLVGAAQVGKSSLTGMRVLHQLQGRLPIWPFDPVPERGPVIVEIYTSIAARAAGIRKGRSKIRDSTTLDSALAAVESMPHAPLIQYNDHVTDAILTTAWLRLIAQRPELWSPKALTPQIAATEGWTFGVT
jgi:hypothetical protein